MECTAALFDVDGTLVDTNYLHAVTWWQAFANSGYGVDMTDIHRAIGMGSDQLLDHLLPPDRDCSRDDVIRQTHDALFSVYWSHLRPLPGAAALLRTCKTWQLATDAEEIPMAREIGREQVRLLMDEGAQIVEVLPAREYSEDHLPGAINLPLRRVETEATQVLDPSRPVVVYCADSG